MPFFYSQYLKDAKPSRPPKSQTTSVSKNKSPSNNKGGQRPGLGVKRPSFSNKLVWHSNIGASGRSREPRNFKPLGYTDGDKVVHFSTIEVQPFHFDWSLADDVFYSRKELQTMGQSRFDDAATLRAQRRLSERNNNNNNNKNKKNTNGGELDGHTVDDVDIVKKSNVQDIATLLSMALEDDDQDENVSIRGIEHFVYPDLQQEMIRRKKEVQREVLEFVRSKRPDPQGWRLAQHSRTFSQWARNVALEKGMKYCMNNVANDDEITMSKDELERIQRSTDELEASCRSLRGSSSFSGTGSVSFDNDERHTGLNELPQISEGGDKKDNGEGDAGEKDNGEEDVDALSQSIGEKTSEA